MSVGLDGNPARGIAALRRLTKASPALEHCDLCAAVLHEEHQHLVNPEKRAILCACDACAILFDQAGATRYRRVPRDIRLPAGLEIGDALWSSFAIPIGLVFFFRSSVSKSILAVYPSPGGPAEVEVEEEVWQELARLHSSVATLTQDVEALLVNRTRGVRDCYIVPIDECYKLAGTIRRHWSGFTGGDRLWDEVSVFFAALKQRARPEWSAVDA